MADHYACVGIPGDEASIMEAINHTLANGESHRRDDGGRSLVWRDESAASVTVHLTAEDEIVCALPSYRTELAIPVYATDLYEDDDCPFCAVPTLDLVDEQGEMITRLGSQLEDLDPVRRDLAPTALRAARLAAFAEELQSWAGEEEYEHDEMGEGGLASQALIPIGLFVAAGIGQRRFSLRKRRRSTGREAASVIMTGVVDEWQSRRNALTDQEFVRIRVRSYGASFDVVASPADVGEDLAAGSIVQVGAWMVGTLE